MSKLVRRLCVVAAIAILGATAAGTAVAGEHALTPVFPESPFGPVVVRPANINFSEAGDAPFIGGRTRNSKVSWTKWTAMMAVGSGAVWVDPCEPDCAADPYSPYLAVIKLSDPKHVGTKVVFTRMRIQWLGREKGPIADQIIVEPNANGSFFFSY